ncbi:MAG: tetratricopeptide repeat protein, partial [Flavobacteriaceae bacterium]
DAGLVEEQFNALEILSSAFTSHGFFAPALEYGQQFLDLSKKVVDTLRMGEAYMLMGRTLREQHRFEESESMLNRALELQIGSKKSKRNTAYAYLHLANLYQKMGKYGESIAQVRKGLDVALYEQSRSADFLIARLKLQLIQTKLAMGDYDFEGPLEEVKVLVRDNSFLFEQANCYYFEGLLMERSGKIDRAIDLYSNSFTLFNTLGSTDAMALVSNRMIDQLREKGAIAKGVHDLLRSLLDNLDRSVAENRARYLFSSYYYMSIAEKARSEMLDVQHQAANEQLRNKRANNRYLTLGLIALAFISAYLFHLYREKNIRERKLRTANAQLEKQKAEIDHLLQLNNRTLYSKQLKISTIQDSIAKVAQEISGLLGLDGPIGSSLLLGVEKKLLGVASNEGTWEEFKHQFEEIHPDFFKNLSELHPNLSVNDLKHCSYILSNLKNKEVAGLINVSPRSVETTRYRLKKKLGLSQEENLYRYLHHI